MPNKTREALINDARNNSMVIALIYSPAELYEYIVEIISKDSNNFIKNGNQIMHFHSVDEALSYVTKYEAEEFFLCVENTYDECGPMISAQRFDCIPIHSRYKKNPN